MKALILEKLFSRKLVAFAVATGLLISGHLPVAMWVSIALVYMGAQSVVDAVEKFTKKSK